MDSASSSTMKRCGSGTPTTATSSPVPSDSSPTASSSRTATARRVDASPKASTRPDRRCSSFVARFQKETRSLAGSRDANGRPPPPPPLPSVGLAEAALRAARPLLLGGVSSRSSADSLYRMVTRLPTCSLGRCQHCRQSGHSQFPALARLSAHDEQTTCPQPGRPSQRLSCGHDSLAVSRQTGHS